MENDFAFMQDYGLKNGPILMAVDQTNDDFVKSITTFDLNYNAQNLTTTYTAPKSVWENVADSTSEAISTSSNFVWDTSKGAWESTKAGTVAVVNFLDKTAEDVLKVPGSIFDGILMRGFLIFAALVLGFWILAKAGVIKEIAGVFKA